MKKMTPQVGDGIQGDEWRWAELLEESNGFHDGGFPGCQFRIKLPSHNNINLAVNIKVTGKPRLNRPYTNWKSRCQIEFVGDCEPSTFNGGVLYHSHE